MEYNPTARPAPTPVREFASRAGTLWALKAAGTTVAMALFFTVYFRLLEHPLFPVAIVPRTVLDRWIGFHPAALPVYLSLWVYVVLVPALLRTRRELFFLAVDAAALSVIGFAFFLFRPTAVPRPDIDWSLHPAFFFLKRVDSSGNAFPSLHAAFAVFAAIWLDRMLREMRAGAPARALNLLWCVGIVISTVATLQHVALDALSGAALGALVGTFGLPRRTGGARIAAS